MIVIFLDIVSKVNYLVERGVVIHDTFVPVLPLVSPAKRVTISNAPPFIKNEAKELSRYDHLISPIKIKVSLGANLCSSNMLCVTGGRFYDPQRHRWRAEPVFQDRGFQLHVRA